MCAISQKTLLPTQVATVSTILIEYFDLFSDLLYLVLPIFLSPKGTKRQKFWRCYCCLQIIWLLPSLLNRHFSKKIAADYYSVLCFELINLSSIFRHYSDLD